MNKTGLMAGAASYLREKGYRKKLPPAKRIFYLSDDEGNSKQMVVTFGSRDMVYTARDVGIILEAILHTIYEAMKRGEPVQIIGFGTLRVKLAKGRVMKHVSTGKETVVKDRYIPRIVFGKTANLCAKLYELSLKDKVEEVPLYSDEDYMFEDDEIVDDEILEDEFVGDETDEAYDLSSVEGVDT